MNYQVYESRLLSFENAGQPWPHNDSFLSTPATLAEFGFYFEPNASGPDRVVCYLCCNPMKDFKSDEHPMAKHQHETVECPLVLLHTKWGNEKALRTARKNTFKNWWPYKTGFLATTAKLAAAGFIYYPLKGKIDNVRCYECGFQCFCWTPEDEPFEVHKSSVTDSDGAICPFVKEFLMTDNVDMKGFKRKSISDLTEGSTTKTTPKKPKHELLSSQPVTPESPVNSTRVHPGTSTNKVLGTSEVKLDYKNSSDNKTTTINTTDLPVKVDASKKNVTTGPTDYGSVLKSLFTVKSPLINVPIKTEEDESFMKRNFLNSVLKERAIDMQEKNGTASPSKSVAHEQIFTRSPSVTKVSLNSSQEDISNNHMQNKNSGIDIPCTSSKNRSRSVSPNLSVSKVKEEMATKPVPKPKKEIHASADEEDYDDDEMEEEEETTFDKLFTIFNQELDTFASKVQKKAQDLIKAQGTEPNYKKIISERDMEIKKLKSIINMQERELTRLRKNNMNV